MKLKQYNYKMIKEKLVVICLIKVKKNYSLTKLFRKNIDINVPYMEYNVMNNKKKYNKKDNKPKKQTTKLQTMPTKLQIEVITDKGKVKNDFTQSNVGIKINAKIEKAQ